MAAAAVPAPPAPAEWATLGAAKTYTYDASTARRRRQRGGPFSGRGGGFCRNFCFCCGDDWSLGGRCELVRDDGGQELAGALEGAGYCDAHCHLDCCLLNEKQGDEAWSLKKWLCERWEEGDCWWGGECDYAHGEHELAVRAPLHRADFEPFARRHPTDAWRRGVGAADAGKGVCAHCGGKALRDHGRISNNGVLFCSISHFNEYRQGRALPEADAAAGWEVPAPPPPPPPAYGRPGLRCLITSCCERASIEDTTMLVAAGEALLGGAVFATFGCHPHNYRDYDDALEARLLAALRACGRRAVGWGECGLDYYKNCYDAELPERRAKMVEVFSRQASLAAARGLPLVVHSRDAEEDTMAVLRASLPRDHPVHLHAFQGSLEMLSEFFDLFPNAVVGVSGAVTFQQPWGSVARIVWQTPLERLVLETDAPFLSTEPRDIPDIAAAVARIKGLSTAEVLAATSANCENLYRINRINTGSPPNTAAVAGEAAARA